MLRQGRSDGGLQVTFKGWPFFLCFLVPWLIGLGTIVNWIFS